MKITHNNEKLSANVKKENPTQKKKQLICSILQSPPFKVKYLI